MRSIGHFIGGREVKGTSGRTGDIFEPMTGDIQAKVALASKAEVRAAVENARAAQPEWAATNPQRRVRVLMKFLELVARELYPQAFFGGTVSEAHQQRVRKLLTKNIAGFKRLARFAPYLAGEQFTMADIMNGSLLLWARPSRLRTGRPKIEAWLDRIAARPDSMKLGQ